MSKKSSKPSPVKKPVENKPSEIDMIQKQTSNYYHSLLAAMPSAK